MKRLLVLGVCLLVGLLLTDYYMRWRDGVRRSRESTLRPLLMNIRQYVEGMGGFQIDVGPNGRTWTYRNEQGVWRCPDFEHAFVLIEEANRFLGDLLNARSTVVHAEFSPDTHYGLSPDTAMKVRMLDGRGDVLLEIWVGRGVPASTDRESYVKLVSLGGRTAGLDTIYHLHADPRQALERARADALPPLVDPYVIPRVLNRKPIVEVGLEGSSPGGIERLRCDLENPLTPVPGAPMEGIPRYNWWATTGGKEAVVDPGSAGSYVTFLAQMRYEALLPPGSLVAGQPGTEAARLRLVDADDVVDTLVVGARNSDGSAVVRLVTTGQSFSVDPETARRLYPQPADLLPVKR